MDIGTILGWLLVAILFRFVIGYSMKSWGRRKEGSGHEVDLNSIGRGHYVDLAAIKRIERLLKEEAEKEHPES